MSLCLFVLGTGFFSVLITAALKQNFASESTVGLVHSAYFMGMLIGGLCIQRIVQRLGHILCFKVFAVIIVVNIAMMAYWPSPTSWFILRLFFGILISALYIVVESWMLLLSQPSNRGAIVAIYMLVMYATQTFSQGLLYLVGTDGSLAFIVGAILVVLSIFPIYGSQALVGQTGSSCSVSIFHLIKISFFGLLACLVGGIVQGGVYASMPSFALAYGRDAAFLVSIAILGGGLLQWPIGKWSDRLGRPRMLLWISIALTLVCFAMRMAHVHDVAAFWLSFFIGGFSFALYSLGVAFMCDRLHAQEVTGATAWALVAYGVGSVLGPLFAPWFMLPQACGLFTFYGWSSLVLVMVGFLEKSRVNPGAPGFD